MILLLFLIKTCHVSQRSRKLLLNEKFIFNTKPLYEAEGIEPIHKHHDLYKNHTHHHDECGNSKNEQNPKMNKILKSINSVKNKIK